MAELETVRDDAAEPGDDRSQELEWVLAKSLLDANAHAVRAFEHHLLQTYREDATLDLESVQSNIRRAIDEHEKIIEELEVAAQAVDERRGSSESTSRR